MLLCVACTSRLDQRRAAADLELERLYASDQADRQPGSRPLTPAEIDSQINVVVARDSARRTRVRELLAQDRISTPTGYARAAMIINHAHDTASYLVALALAQRGLQLDSTHREAGRLAAITADNLRWKRGTPTWYSIKVTGGLHQPPVAHPIDPARVTDAERLRLGFDSLVKQQREVEAMIGSWKPRRAPPGVPGGPR